MAINCNTSVHLFFEPLFWAHDSSNFKNYSRLPLGLNIFCGRTTIPNMNHNIYFTDNVFNHFTPAFQYIHSTLWLSTILRPTPLNWPYITLLCFKWPSGHSLQFSQMRSLIRLVVTQGSTQRSGRQSVAQQMAFIMVSHSLSSLTPFFSFNADLCRELLWYQCYTLALVGHNLVSWC